MSHAGNQGEAVSESTTPTPEPAITWADFRHYSWERLTHALTSEVSGDFRTRCAALYTEPRRTWDLDMGYSGAVDLTMGRTKWKAGQRSIEQTAREQAAKAIQTRAFYDYAYDTTGAFFDMPAVIEGRPECWLAPTPNGAGERGLVRMIVDLGTSAHVRAAVIEARMCAIAAACLVIEANGNPIEVIAIDSQGFGALPYCNAVQVNNAGEPIDSQRLVAMAHPAFLRRVMFRLQELTPRADVSAEYEFGYGSALALTPAVVSQTWGDRCVYIPSLYNGDVAPTCASLLALVKQRLGVDCTDDAEGEETCYE